MMLIYPSNFFSVIKFIARILALTIWICAFLVAGFAFAGPKNPPPKVPSCKLRDVPQPVALHIVDPKTGEFQNISVDDYLVLCEVHQGKKKLEGRYLPLAHPTDYDTAMRAAKEYLASHQDQPKKEESKP